MLEILKAVILGIVEGITEFLPISSTGHLVLVDEFIKLNEPKKFIDMFNVVIQLGAIMAVVVLYFHKLNPWSPKKSRLERSQTWTLWKKVDRPDRLRGLVHRNRKPQPKPTAPL